MKSALPIIGLTGGVASGKSTVAARFREYGVPVVDADAVARDMLRPGHVAYQAVIQAFGVGVLCSSSGEESPIDREQLAALVFSDPAARKKLEGIVHPAIQTESERQFSQWAQNGKRWGLYEAALLVETGRYGELNGLIVVDVPIAVQVERAQNRGWPVEQIQARIQAQADRRTRLQAATWVIHNEGTLDETYRQVDALYREITGQWV